MAALALLIAAGAQRERTSALGDGLGQENSWIRIQNVGRFPATIDVQFYDVDGRPVGTDGCPRQGGCGELAAGFGRSFFQQGLDELSEGYRGSAFVTLDQPFVALLARDAFKDGKFQISGDSLRLGTGRPTFYAPIVQNTSRYVSRISIENLSEDETACVGLVYYAEGQLQPAVFDPPGPTPGCPRGGQLIQPRGTLVRDEFTLPVGMGFDGSAFIETWTNAEGTPWDEQQIAVIVDTRERDGPGLATYRGFADDELSRVVVLPLVDRGASEGQTRWTTRFRIMSGDPTLPNEVTLRFDGVDGDGNRIEVEHTVIVHSSLTCDQAFDGLSGCLPSDVALPASFRGTVRMQAVEPIAVVAQRRSEDGPLADYRGFTAAEASRQIVLPVLNKNFGPWGDNRGWNSWFRVLSFDGSTVHIRVIYFSKQFPGGLFPRSAITIEGQGTVAQWENRELPDGWVGSAIVVADRPVVILANLESDVFDGDPVMLYNGVSLE